MLGIEDVVTAVRSPWQNPYRGEANRLAPPGVPQFRTPLTWGISPWWTFSASLRVGADVELVFAVENLLDKQYLVGRAGVDTVGQPRFVHAGIRVRYGR